MTSTSFTLRPISPKRATELRHGGGETYVADAFPGYPCRQCLKDAAIGEELILVSHDPFETDSPYRSASPIFLHKQDCGMPSPGVEIPEQLTRRQLSVRAFDVDALMIDAAVIDGKHLEATMEGFFADANTVNIHIHNASRGCWAVSAARQY